MKSEQLLTKILPIIFGVCVIIFGWQHVYYGTTNPALLPCSGAIGECTLWAYVTGIIMAVCGALPIINRWQHQAFTIIGIILLLALIFAHIPQLFYNIKNANEWTVAFETLAIMSGSFLLALRFNNQQYIIRRKDFKDILLKINKNAFATALVVFSILHFLYAAFIAQLIPAWIPFHLFWAYFVGVAFFSAAMSLFFNLKLRLAMSLLGIMFLFWTCFVHAPRVYDHPSNRDEWSSMCIALIISCVGFTIAQP